MRTGVDTGRTIELPSFVVITQTGISLLMFSALISIYGLLIKNPVFLVPGLTLPLVLIIFATRMILQNYDEITIDYGLVTPEIKAKQFLPIHFTISSNVAVSGSLSIKVSDGLFPVVTPQSTVIDTSVKNHFTFLFYGPRRGKEKILSATFQFSGIYGLFYIEKRLLINKEIIVLPQDQRLSLPWKQKQRILDALIAEITTTIKGRGSEFLSLRDFVYGDEVRYIHWRASAKYDKLIVKEFEEPRALRFLIVVDASLYMAGPKLEFALSSAVELATIIQRSDHSVSVLVQGFSYSQWIHIGKSVSALNTLSIKLHAIKPEGTGFSYEEFKKFLVNNKQTGSVIILITDVELAPVIISKGMTLLKPYFQAFFFCACSSTGFGTLALTKVRDFSSFNLDQLYYRREIIEPTLDLIYKERIAEYQKIVENPRSQFHLIESYNTNILLELSKALTLLSKKRRSF